MPIPGEWIRAMIRDRLKGKTAEQQLAEISKIEKEIPWTVGEYRDIRSELKEKAESLSKTISRKGSMPPKYYFERERPSISMIGTTKSGKSTLLSRLTTAKPKISDIPYTTTMPELGSLMINDIRIQLVELPSLYKGSSEKNKELFSIIRDSNAVMTVVRGQSDLNLLLSELEKSRIILHPERVKNHSSQNADLPGLVAYRDEEPSTLLPKVRVSELDEMKELTYKSLGITRIYPRLPTNEIDNPVIFYSYEVTVKDFVEKVNRRLLVGFRYAKRWGQSPNYQGERIGLNMKLADGDILRIYTK